MCFSKFCIMENFQILQKAVREFPMAAVHALRLSCLPQRDSPTAPEAGALEASGRQAWVLLEALGEDRLLAFSSPYRRAFCTSPAPLPPQPHSLPPSCRTRVLSRPTLARQDHLSLQGP